MRTTPAPHAAFPQWLAQNWQPEDWRYTNFNHLKPVTGPAHMAPPPNPPSLSGQKPAIIFMNGRVMAVDNLPDGFKLEDGMLTIADHTVCKTLVEITRIHHGGVSDNRFHIHVGEGADIVLLEYHPPAGDGSGLHTGLTHTILEKNARLSRSRVCDNSRGLTSILEDHVMLAEGSTHAFNIINTGGTVTRQNTRINLEGAQSASLIRAVNIARASHIDLLTDVRHRVAHTRSSQAIRALAGEKGRTVFQGKIVVNPNAQKTESQQNHQGLLLSDDAEIDAKPGLEIYADDVKCSHGATCGALDDTALFYLKSRGIASKDAAAMLLNGFVSSLFDEDTGHDELATLLKSFLATKIGAA